MRKTNQPLRRLLAVACGVTLAGGIVLLSSSPAWTDDVDLLRFSTAKPYLFIEFDTSGSMSLAPDGRWLPAGGDDPDSKIYQAKQVLYEVFSEVDDMHLGFASYDQDELGVVAKHWLYRARPGSGFSIGYPAPGEPWTFGRHYDDEDTAGSCADPIDLEDPEGRAKLNSFAKLDQDGLGPTYLIFKYDDELWAMSITSSADQLGQNRIDVDLVLGRAVPIADTDTGCTIFPLEQKTIQFDLDREFLAIQDEEGFYASTGDGEQLAGFWDWDDVTNSFVCPSGLPGNQRGSGWEGNYDGTFFAPPGFDVDPKEDPFGQCGNRNNPSNCDSLFRPTTLSSFGRALDRGDVLPLDWASDNKDAFLQRLAPNHLAGSPDFGIASYFRDDPESDGFLHPKSAAQIPLIPSGETPIGRASGDFRCFYRGNTDNKCPSEIYNTGWDTIAKDNDPEWGCRKPYQIVLSDGLDTCGGPNPASDTANLNSKAGVRTWVIAYGADCTKVGNPLKPMAQNGKGELVCPQDPTNLKDELNRILGIIREEARAFASAAAPTVQTAVADKIYLSSFTPLNNKSVWDGHINTFLKPVPLDLSGKPDVTHPNFLWDAGMVLRDTQAPTQAEADSGTLRLGDGANERRVFYSRLTDSNGDTTLPGQWPFRRRLLDWTEDSTDADIRYDLWSGLQIPFNPDDPLLVPAVDQTAQDRANQILANNVAIKTHTLDDGTPITYVLGDMFHSTPVAMGTPPNVRYFALDLENDGTTCALGNPGYRCFQEKHRYRRQMLIVGSNDGQLHFFDAGLPQDIDPDPVQVEVEFDNGTGSELFAYVPRSTMPVVRSLAEGTNHRWGVDGNPAAADVFIDPIHNEALLDPPDPAEREWRTVVITGLREGGRAYFALDVTQPDLYDTDGLADPINTYVPSCLGSLDLVEDVSDLTVGCGPTPFPAALWEFNDSVVDTTVVPAVYRRLDEDGNGVGDLADSWSTPTIGIVEICEGSDCDPLIKPNHIVRKHVAVFGGGMDAGDKINPRAGHWIYMLDIETGKVIYKRQVDGAVAANVAAVDTDQNGILDRIYAVTVGGFAYRVDISLDSAGKVPTLADTMVSDITGVIHTVKRVPETDSAALPLWAPRLIFDANFDGEDATPQPRPLYQRPSVIFVARLGLYALAFGTGDREDLWIGTQQEGRFYVFVDDTDLLLPADLPLTEADLAPVAVGADDVNVDFLLERPTGQKGWFIPLDSAERVITEAFALSGVTFFSTFQPDVEVSGGSDPLCSKTGSSRVFIVNTTNANQFLRDEYDEKTRYMTVANFVTNPYAEQSQTRNPETTDPSPPLPPDLQDVMEALKSLFPTNCTFANYHIAIKTISADTGVIFIAPVPVCIIEKNWRGN